MDQRRSDDHSKIRVSGAPYKATMVLSGGGSLRSHDGLVLSRIQWLWEFKIATWSTGVIHGREFRPFVYAKMSCPLHLQYLQRDEKKFWGCAH